MIANTASMVLPADTTIDDPSLGSNSATGTDQIDFTFRDGFENPPVSAPSGSARIPALALARELDDEARVVNQTDPSAPLVAALTSRVRVTEVAPNNVMIGAVRSTFRGMCP